MPASPDARALAPRSARLSNDDFGAKNLEESERNRTAQFRFNDSGAVNLPLFTLIIGQVNQEPSMPTRARAAATDAREDIISPAAMSALSPGVVSAMGTVGAAVLKMHKQALDKKPDWFWHLFAVCEAKAARIAEQATHGAGACGDATFVEMYAKSLPALVTKALAARTSKH
jgi:hypothetical protein